MTEIKHNLLFKTLDEYIEHHRDFYNMFPNKERSEIMLSWKLDEEENFVKKDWYCLLEAFVWKSYFKIRDIRNFFINREIKRKKYFREKYNNYFDMENIKEILGADYLKRFKVFHPQTLFEPQWNMLREKRCPLCSNKLRFLLNKKHAMCASKKHKVFIISVDKLNKLSTLSKLR